MRLTILILLTLILLSASKNDENKKLRFVCWDLISVKTFPDEVVHQVIKSKPFLVLKDSVFYGNDGCNDCVGGCSVINDSIILRNGGSTMQGCPEIQRIGILLFKKLMNGKSKYLISGDTLFLITKNTDIFKFQKRANQNTCYCKFSDE